MDEISPFLLDELYYGKIKLDHITQRPASRTNWKNEFRKLELLRNSILDHNIENKLHLIKQQAQQMNNTEPQVMDVNQTLPMSSESRISHEPKIKSRMRHSTDTEQPNVEFMEISRKLVKEGLSQIISKHFSLRSQRQLIDQTRQAYNPTLCDNQRRSQDFYSNYSSSQQFQSTNHINKSVQLRSSPIDLGTQIIMNPARKVKLLPRVQDTKSPVRRSNISIIQREQQDFIRMSESSQPVQNIKLHKRQIHGKLQAKFGTRLTGLFLDFLELPAYLDFKDWKKLKTRLVNLHMEQVINFSFRLFDVNQDRFVCSNDLFHIQLCMSETLQSIHTDVKIIHKFVKERLNDHKSSEEELYNLQRSKTIRYKVLRLSEIEKWAPLEKDTFIINLGKKYQRVSPMFSYVSSENYFMQPLDIPQIPTQPENHPTQYNYDAPFALNFLQFRWIWIHDQTFTKIQLWEDFIDLFMGKS